MIRELIRRWFCPPPYTPGDLAEDWQVIGDDMRKVMREQLPPDVQAVLNERELYE